MIDEPPTIVEVENAIKRLKNNKSPGSDEITSEFLKKGCKPIKEELHKILEKCWENETVTIKWKAFHKKSDPTNFNNYRGIALLNTACKILSLILLKKYKCTQITRSSNNNPDLGQIAQWDQSIE